MTLSLPQALQHPARPTSQGLRLQHLMLSSCIVSVLLVSLLPGTDAFTPATVDFERAAALSLTFLKAGRSGSSANDSTIPWRSTSSLQDLSGGFYNDGAVGPVKVTWNIAYATTLLAWSLLEHQEYWSRSLDVHNDIVSLVWHGVSYIEACYHISQGNDPEGDQIIYLV